MDSSGPSDRAWESARRAPPQVRSKNDEQWDFHINSLAALDDATGSSSTLPARHFAGAPAAAPASFKAASAPAAARPAPVRQQSAVKDAVAAARAAAAEASLSDPACGSHGLQNQGNSCYLSAATVALLHATPFLRALLCDVSTGALVALVEGKSRALAEAREPLDAFLPLRPPSAAAAQKSNADDAIFPFEPICASALGRAAFAALSPRLHARAPPLVRDQERLLPAMRATARALRARGASSHVGRSRKEREDTDVAEARSRDWLPAPLVARGSPHGDDDFFSRLDALSPPPLISRGYFAALWAVAARRAAGMQVPGYARRALRAVIVRERPEFGGRTQQDAHEFLQAVLRGVGVETDAAAPLTAALTGTWLKDTGTALRRYGAVAQEALLSLDATAGVVGKKTARKGATGASASAAADGGGGGGLGALTGFSEVLDTGLPKLHDSVYGVGQQRGATGLDEEADETRGLGGGLPHGALPVDPIDRSLALELLSIRVAAAALSHATPIGRVFSGELRTTLDCTACGLHRSRVEPVTDLTLPLPELVSSAKAAVPAPQAAVAAPILPKAVETVETFTEIECSLNDSYSPPPAGYNPAKQAGYKPAKQASVPPPPDGKWKKSIAFDETDDESDVVQPTQKKRALPELPPATSPTATPAPATPSIPLNLERLLEELMAPRQLELRCPHPECSSAQVAARTTLSAVPRVLVLCVKRFIWDESIGASRKAADPVAFGASLDVTRFLDTGPVALPPPTDLLVDARARLNVLSTAVQSAVATSGAPGAYDANREAMRRESAAAFSTARAEWLSKKDAIEAAAAAALVLDATTDDEAVVKQPVKKRPATTDASAPRREPATNVAAGHGAAAAPSSPPRAPRMKQKRRHDSEDDGGEDSKPPHIKAAGGTLANIVRNPPLPLVPSTSFESAEPVIPRKKSLAPARVTSVSPAGSPIEIDGDEASSAPASTERAGGRGQQNPRGAAVRQRALAMMPDDDAAGRAAFSQQEYGGAKGGGKPAAKTCPACTFLNAHYLDECEICQAKLSEAKKATTAHADSVIAISDSESSVGVGSSSARAKKTLTAVPPSLESLGPPPVRLDDEAELNLSEPDYINPFHREALRAAAAKAQVKEDICPSSSAMVIDDDNFDEGKTSAPASLGEPPTAAPPPPEEDAPEPCFYPCESLLPAGSRAASHSSVVYDLTAVVHHIGGDLKSGHYVTDTRGPLTLDIPADLGLTGVDIAARASDRDDPYGVLRQLHVLEAIDATQSQPAPERADDCSFDSGSEMAERIKALAPDRPWYRHDDSTVRRISAFDVFGREAQRTAYIFVFTLREN
jgi:hypothetical protein